MKMSKEEKIVSLQIIVDKGLRYERLKENEDFKIYLEDIQKGKNILLSAMENFEVDSNRSLEQNALPLLEVAIQSKAINKILKFIDTRISEGKIAQAKIVGISKK